MQPTCWLLEAENWMFSPKLPTKSIQDGTGSQFCWHKVPFQHHIGIQEAILCGLGTCWSVEPCGKSENEAADHALIGNDLPLWKALPNLFGLWSFWSIQHSTIVLNFDHLAVQLSLGRLVTLPRTSTRWLWKRKLFLCLAKGSLFRWFRHWMPQKMALSSKFHSLPSWWLCFLGLGDGVACCFAMQSSCDGTGCSSFQIECHFQFLTKTWVQTLAREGIFTGLLSMSTANSALLRKFLLKMRVWSMTLCDLACVHAWNWPQNVSQCRRLPLQAWLV